MSHKTVHTHHSKPDDRSISVFIAIIIPILIFAIVFVVLFMRNQNLQVERKASYSQHVSTITPTAIESESSKDTTLTEEEVEIREQQVPPPTL